MMVAREDEINAGLAQGRKRRPPAADAIEPRRAFGRRQRMVDDHHLEDRVAVHGEGLRDLLHLRVGDAALLEGQRSRGVDAEHGDLAIPEAGAAVGAEEALEPAERPGEATDDVVERHVVIARDDHHRRRPQPVEEGARRGELAAAGALGEVAADRDEVGRRPK